MLDDAESERDGAARDVLESVARSAQEEWSCPLAGYPLSKPKTPGCRETLLAVERLIGHPGSLRTCPRVYLRLAWVIRASRARVYREAGSLSSVESLLDAPMLDALDVIDSANAERVKREMPKPRDPK